MFRILTMLTLALAALIGPLTGPSFFEKNLQRYPVRSDGKWNAQGQWRRIRRGGGHTAGQITFHTYEAPMGRTVLAGATYLLTRTTPGSYHWLFDVHRAFLRLAPWPGETWHAVPTNNWAASASAMMHAVDWKRLNAAPAGSQLWQWRQNLIYGFALAAADFSRWLVAQGRDPVPKRILTREQAMRQEAGFNMHRHVDPDRRTDAANPERDFPWDEIFAEYDRILAEGTTPTPPPAPTPSARPDVEVQLALAVLDLYDAGPDLEYLDGINGSAQRAAVTTYQRRYHLTPDGWWGPSTDTHFEENIMASIVEQITTAVQRAVLNAPIAVSRGGQATTRKFATVIEGLAADQQRELTGAGERAGYLEALLQVAGGKDIDLDAVADAAFRGAQAGATQAAQAQASAGGEG